MIRTDSLYGFKNILFFEWDLGSCRRISKALRRAKLLIIYHVIILLLLLLPLVFDRIILMVIRENTSTDNPEELKKMLFNMTAKCNKLEETTSRYEREIDILREKVQLLSAKLFGKSSEKRTTFKPDLAYKEYFDLFPLFDGEEPSKEDTQIHKDQTSGKLESEENESINISGYERAKGGRKALPEELHRIDIIHDIEEQDKECACGCTLSRIGEEVTEQLEIPEAKVYVNRHIRPKYACKGCEGIETEGGTVKVSPVEEKIIPKAIAGASLLAHIMTAKFVNSMPFYRQEKHFERIGIHLNRSTMSSWAIKLADRCLPLMDLLKEEIHAFERINMDETTLQVMNEDSRSNTTKSYMWLFAGGPPDKRSILYHYHPTRSSSVAESFLEGYEGHVQTDGYSGYYFLDEKEGITPVGCFAHARRKFSEVTTATGKKKSKKGLANQALDIIGLIYDTERQIKGSPEEITRQRKEKVKPLLDEFHKWLIDKKPKVPPKTLLGKAIAYSLNHWKRLERYIECPYLTPDNNVSENAIRPFVVGRKNWMFAGSPKGAHANAVMYSLIETAKANGINPLNYLNALFTHLPKAKTKEEQRALLPQYIDLELLK